MALGTAMAVSAGTNLLGGLMGRNKAKAQQRVQNAQSDLQQSQRYNSNLRQENKQLSQLKGNNEQALDANIRTLERSKVRDHLLNAQRSMAKGQQAAQRAQLLSKGQAAQGQQAASDAAQGTIGNSVQERASDIEHTMQDALIKNDQSADVQQKNFRTQRLQNQWSLEDSVQDVETVENVDKAQKPSTVHQDNVPSFGNVLGSSLMQTGMQYANMQMSLGMDSGGGGGSIDSTDEFSALDHLDII